MKRVWPIALSCVSLLALHAGDDASSPAAELDASAAVALAYTIPLLAIHRNNDKHPANPILTAGEPGA